MEKEKLQYYIVKIEAEVPAVIHYKILANSPGHAESLIKYRDPVRIEYNPKKRKNLTLRIYESGTAILHILKSLL